jgi:Ca2+-binding EF-hand superfamily protein
LNIDLKRVELEGLFKEIDIDNNGSIDIDELIYFMTNNQEGISSAASSALLSVSKIIYI